MEHKAEISVRNQATEPMEASSLTLEIYQYLLQVSREKIQPLPTITKIAQDLNISRQRIYQWINGQITAPEISAYLKSVTEISFPERLIGKNVSEVRQFFRIR